jgi:serine/threonine protein kinase
MPSEPRKIRHNRKTFEVRDERRIKGEQYLVVGNYGSGDRPRERVLQQIGKHQFQEKVIHRLPNTKDNWRRIQHLNRIQGSHLPFARISSTGKAGDDLLVVVEHIAGKSLRWHFRMGKRLSAFQAIRLYSQLVTQLCNLYRATGIIHGDIAPKNIVVCPKGTRLVLIDFGSSFRFTDSANKDDGDGGRPDYQAPEQLAGAPASRLTEQFSAASVFYEMLTRKTPFNVVEKTDRRSIDSTAGRPSELAAEKSDLPDQVWHAVDEHVLKAISLKSENRYSTIGKWQDSAKQLRDYANRPELAPPINSGMFSSIAKKLFGN